jgi:hypothetical protein
MLRVIILDVIFGTSVLLNMFCCTTGWMDKREKANRSDIIISEFISMMVNLGRLSKYKKRRLATDNVLQRLRCTDENGVTTSERNGQHARITSIASTLHQPAMTMITKYSTI